MGDKDAKAKGEEGKVDTFEVFKVAAIDALQAATAPHRPGAGSGSLDPRA